MERDRKMIRSIVAQGIEGQEISVPMGKGICGTVAATGERINSPDAYADSRFDASFDAALGYCTNDIYCMSIINRCGEVVGV